ncbi:hypothetical protein EJ02DRAFT_226000 [Clathrospora elynae]|uniref:F-box domain-containing protein n=1 Tax=Clathrospora elynae TaxID=706981 RepID=A0A6A5SLR3_9PLEO|nr:hypothetical protein EJ02DRAFT_226000 [Clathrospora elynae]
MAALSALPNEILSLITNHFERPRDLLSLSLASRRLSEFAKLDGWKALLKGRLGVGGLDSDARNSVHGLTTLYRNWDRKGFVARYLEPSENTTSINTWQPKRWRGPQGQTMGYQPSIDSYEEMYGEWGERREVLAWSAGTQIVMRVKEAGLNIEKIRKSEEGLDQSPDQTWTYDAFNHLNSWFTYKIPNSLEGRDDITSLKLLRPHQRDMAYEDIVFGTASGQLSLLSVNPDLCETLEQEYETGGRGVGATSISSSSTPMLAATLGDSSLALYPIDRDNFSNDPIEPSTHVTPAIQGEARIGRIWSCKFLSNDKIAIGHGPSYEPIEVYEITPDSILSEPLRTFNLDSGYDQRPRPDGNVQHSTSVYPMLPIPSTSQGGSEAGNTFLSGGYDGIIRLHDMRSPRGFETKFWDPTNDSSIYSLAAHGLERIVAGVSMHSMIKVFDLRLSGSHAYHTVSLPSKPKSKSNVQDFASSAVFDENRGTTSTISGGWNLYLSPRVSPRRNAYREDYSRVRDDSSVYSLTIPSSNSQNIYAGMEGVVQSLIFHSVTDSYPDTMLSQSLTRSPVNGTIDVQASYNPRGDVLSLGMYEQGNEEGLGMQLLVQDDVASGIVKSQKREIADRARGLDERWRDPRDDADRWVRGGVLPVHAPRRGRGRGQGGRGRGRGRGN